MSSVRRCMVCGGYSPKSFRRVWVMELRRVRIAGGRAARPLGSATLLSPSVGGVVSFSTEMEESVLVWLKEELRGSVDATEGDPGCDGECGGEEGFLWGASGSFGIGNSSLTI